MLAGVLSGIPFWLAIIKNKANETIRAWRVAHSFLVIDGLMMLIVGLVIPYIVLSKAAVWLLALTFIIAGYGFVFVFIIGAWKGLRGLTAKPYGLNTILFGGHIIGISCSLIGIIILIYGLFRMLY
jgi:hypothetical protein